MEFALSLFLFALASNLDTLILALAWGVRGHHLSGVSRLVIAGLTTVVTWLSLALGHVAGTLFAAGSAGTLGALVLIVMGLWTLLDWLQNLGQPVSEPAQTPGEFLCCLALAAALAVNNGGMGVAAGVAGIPPLWAASVNLVMTLLLLELGWRMGLHAVGSFWRHYAIPISGALLVLLGVLECIL